MGGGHDRIGGAVGDRPVPASPAHDEAQAVHGGHEGAGLHPHRPHGELVPEVDAQHHVHALEHPVADHGLGAALALLRGLEEHPHVPGQLATSEDSGRRRPHGRVPVVAARVHDPGVLRSVGRRALLRDGKRVEVHPQEHGAARAAGGGREHAGSSHSHPDLEAAPGQELGDPSRGAVLREGELGMGVEVAAQRDQLGAEGPHVRGERRHPGILSLESHRSMKRLLRPLLVGAAVVLAAFGYVHLAGNEGNALKKGTPAPPFHLPVLGGGELDLGRLRGRIVVVNFWATWCPPCVAEMPSLERLHRALGKEGLAVVGISVDEDETALRRFVETSGLTFPILRDPGGRVAASAYRIGGYPETFELDAEGVLREHYVGPAEWATPEALEHFRKLLVPALDVR